jgi:hypothetical protein
MADPDTPEEEKAKAAYAGGDTEETESVDSAAAAAAGTGQVVEAEDAALQQTNGHTGPKPSDA